MNKQRNRNYKQQVEQAIASPKLQEALHKFGDAYLLARENAYAGLDFEAMRSEIAAMKDEVRENRDRYLKEFIANAEAAGSTVFLARTAEEANGYIVDLARKRGVRRVVKSKSMASEETHLNKALEKDGIKSLESDLGEYIIQLAGQRPSHMVMPAIHMFKEEVAELFGRETGKEESAEIEHLVRVAREQLRQAYLEADMGVTGANIAVAETGGIALVTNEGNARLASTAPRIHVALVGTEKLVPKLEDAAKIIRMLPRNATGQLLTSYVTWIRGAVPCGEGEKEQHIVLLDNGRSELANDPHCGDALRCMRCGACANVCPVYQTVGGHVLGHIYIGAIGTILTAFFHGLDEASELVKACIGCRACVAICPSKIDLESIILHLRNVVGEKEGIGFAKSVVFKKVMRNRRLFHTLLRAASSLQKPVTKGKRTIRHLPLHFSSLTEWRTLPAIAEKPLRDLLPEVEQEVVSPRYRVALFSGCATDFVFPEMGLSLVKVLNRLGVEVYFPQKQNCCGIPALYSGDRETAVEMAEQNVKAMLEENPDFVVTPCPTCTLALKRDFPELLEDRPEAALQAKALAEKTYDVSAFIANVLQAADKMKGMASAEKITYHDSCHMRRGSGIWEEPRRLLTTAGKELVEMAHADRCCGFGGSYSFTSHPNISREIARDKINDIEATDATTVAVDCPGCLMMLRGTLEKRGGKVRAAHTVELLAEASD
jgi:iron-sulfur cluster protein